MRAADGIFSPHRPSFASGMRRETIFCFMLLWARDVLECVVYKVVLGALRRPKNVLRVVISNWAQHWSLINNMSASVGLLENNCVARLMQGVVIVRCLT